MVRRARLLLLLVLLAQGTLVGQLAPDASQDTSGTTPQLTFRSAVDLIDVDVFVTDREGRFVRDLTQDDFELLEDGEPQAIQITEDDLAVTGIVTTFGGDQVTNEIAWPAPVESGDGRTRGRWGVTIELVLADVAAGCYVLAVEAASGRPSDRTAQRQIVFTVEE
jgi:hypothetical protein